MKNKRGSPSAAFFNPRALIAFALCCLGVTLVLFAVGAAPQFADSKTQAANPSPWLSRFASAFGVHLESPKLAGLPARGGGGAAAALSNSPGEPEQTVSQNQAATPYTGPHNDFRPVNPVHSRPLRELPSIAPTLAPRREIPEPIRHSPPIQVS